MVIGCQNINELKKFVFHQALRLGANELPMQLAVETSINLQKMKELPQKTVITINITSALT